MKIKYIEELKEWYLHPYQFLEEKLKQGEKTFHIGLPGIGKALVTSEPQLLSEIVKNKSLVGGIGTKILDVVVGNQSLITIWGEKHQRHRRILVPYFFQSDHEEISNFSRKIFTQKIDQLNAGETISVEEFTEEVTLKSIIWFLLGDKSDPQVREHLYELVFNWKRSLANPLLLFLRPLQIPFSKSFGWGQFLDLREQIHAVLLGEIRKGPRAPFLQSFVELANQNGLNETDILHECVSIMMFGHDTTAIALSWFVHFAFNNKEYLNKLSRLEHGTEYSEWIRAGLMETLRSAPPVVHLTRVATEDTVVGRHFVKKGQRVFPCIYMAQHDPENFSDPSAFKPERFYGKKETDFRWSYFPFGLGERVCLGKNLGLVQAQVLAEVFMRKVDGQLVDAEFSPVRKYVLIIPKGGTKFTVHRVLSQTLPLTSEPQSHKTW
jgi:cytochrome P450